MKTINYEKKDTGLCLDHVSIIHQQNTGDVATGIHDISLNFDRREVVAILGRSGCGKSTLLKALAGLIQPHQGEVLFNGELVDKPLTQAKMVFQNYSLLPWLTVYDNIAFGLNAQHMHPNLQKEKIAAVMAMIGLSGYEKAYPGELSGGMCQRVGFARALVMNPDILLLDEAFSALDAITAEQLREEFFGLWHTKTIQTHLTVMITHDIQEALAYSDRIIIVGHQPGTIVADFYHQQASDTEVANIKALIEDSYQ